MFTCISATMVTSKQRLLQSTHMPNRLTRHHRRQPHMLATVIRHHTVATLRRRRPLATRIANTIKASTIRITGESVNCLSFILLILKLLENIYIHFESPLINQKHKYIFIFMLYKYNIYRPTFSSTIYIL